MNEWHIYTGSNEPHDNIDRLPSPPRWRDFQGEIREERKPAQKDVSKRRLVERTRGETFVCSNEKDKDNREVDMVNAALYLRRPLLVTGKPGTGKSSLAFSVAYELNLGEVLYWPITTRTTLKDGLYNYDAIGRLQEIHLWRGGTSYDGKSGGSIGETPDIGRFIRLGPLGTAFLPSRLPRVLLIDEIDKSDIDLPNDLLNIFEEGEFEIPELSRIADKTEVVNVFPYDRKDDANTRKTDMVPLFRGRVVCNAFPFIILTSNGEKELPAPFLRRCLRLEIKEPNEGKLSKIVTAHFGNDSEALKSKEELIELFTKRRDNGDLATDQLLNAVYLTGNGVDFTYDGKNELIDDIFRPLNES
ncbi:MAG: AAA family ATPase [Nitrospirae bacterium]|nr:AAA family ATPase [Nitrospirota bacterium]